MTQPHFYPDRISATSGDTVEIFASSSVPICTLTIRRIGKTRDKVLEVELTVGSHPTPDEADRNGCDWPAAGSFTVGSDWQTGYYDLELKDSHGGASHHFICVRKAEDAQKARAVIVLTTNTYAAYNYWGGRNSYAHVEKMQAGEMDPGTAREMALGELSWRRPLAQGLFAPPEGAPRLIADTVRDKDGFPAPMGMDWIMKHQPSSYDGSAGFLQKWEHKFVIWAEENGYEIDYVTDHDFECRNSVLDGYSTVLLVGHSEYWSANGREQLDAFIEDGGNLASLSGNTSYWKVRWTDDGARMIAHKWNGEQNDPLWNDPDRSHEATHLWSHPNFDNPEASTFGLSFLYGGYHRLAMCVARGAAAFTIYNDEHWALEGTDLFYGDLLGSDIPLIGYENDGCPIRFGEDGLPVPDGGLGVPENLQIIGFAPATLAESPRSTFPEMIPPEKTDVLATIAYGNDEAVTQQRLMRGHSVMATFTKGKGEVFNSGTTEWAHGLGVGDAFVEKITHNILARFGVERSAS